MSDNKRNEVKITKKQAIIRLIIAIIVIGICVFLGIYELKRCSNLMKKNDEVMIDKYYEIQNDYERFKAEKENTSSNETENINTISKE